MTPPYMMLDIDIELIQRLDRKGPRYTSYPTADRFLDTFNASIYQKQVCAYQEENPHTPLSLYFHLPFCNTLCYYCACNKIITKDKSRAEKYIDYLIHEIQLQASLFKEKQIVEQLHWGGGTPTFLNEKQMQKLMMHTREYFHLIDEGEYSIEIDPRKVTEHTIQLLNTLGFNRMSLGVQDFDADVQKAVHRIQTEEETFQVMAAARKHGFKSISLDLIYGLPKQTLQSVEITLNKVIAANPDRLSLYNYAHLPRLFTPQRRIQESDLPTAEQKLKILKQSVDQLTAAGYVYIGMDHFAKPNDELTLAQQAGKLHRNFQGYSTHADCDLLAFGVSAIGKIGHCYSQNYRDLENYYAALDKNELPIMRGLELTQDDEIRAAIIQTLMCHFKLDKNELNNMLPVAFDDYFTHELIVLAAYEKEGLIQLTKDCIQVTPKGRMLIRNICMAFDKYLNTKPTENRYSKVI